jgi:arylsulfatase A-like enzyme
VSAANDEISIELFGLLHDALAGRTADRFPLGLKKRDVTIAELLKAQGYATGQFGKNHLGDRDEHLPTNHGFDEFYGNLYHLNAEEEPELPDYPKESDFPNFRKRFGPRGVIHSWALPDGTQKIEDTGPLSRKRMETIDDDNNFLPYLTGEERKGPRAEFFYFTDEAELTALRYDNWKLIFAEQRAPGTLRVWAEPFTPLRVPLMFNLRTDLTNALKLPRTPTTIGCSTTHSCWCRHRPALHSSWRRSMNSRRARRQPASALTRS